MEPIDEQDHVRGPDTARLLVEYGDYECPFSRLAFRDGELYPGALDVDTLVEVLS